MFVRKKGDHGGQQSYRRRVEREDIKKQVTLSLWATTRSLDSNLFILEATRKL